jgi:hypothetical protein
MERRQRLLGSVDPRLHRQGTAGILAALLLAVPALWAEETSVFRCTDPDGAIELSQFPCPAGTEERELRVEDRKTGWTPPRVESQARRQASKDRGRAGKAPAKRDMAAARRADQCWNKRRQLEEVNWKLRHGYRPAEGIKLRRRRQSYEDYIDRYCAGN